MQIQTTTIMDLNVNLVKQIHNLEDKDVEWAVIEEKTPTKTTYKPGLKIKGSSLYVDLLARRLYSPVELPEFKRKIYDAKVIDVDDMIVFVSHEYVHKQIVLPASFLTDMYLPIRYDKDLEGKLLL